MNLAFSVKKKKKKNLAFVSDAQDLWSVINNYCIHRRVTLDAKEISTVITLYVVIRFILKNLIVRHHKTTIIHHHS